MAKRKESDSSVQRGLEIEIFEEFKKELGNADIQHNDKLIPLKKNPKVKINPDFYSEEHRIIGEIHAHLGKLKPAQVRKVATDVLKMLLFEKDYGKKFEKYIVVCDPAEKEQLEGDSYLAEAIKRFKVHIVCVKLTKTQKEDLERAMSAQNFYRAGI